MPRGRTRYRKRRVNLKKKFTRKTRKYKMDQKGGVPETPVKTPAETPYIPLPQPPTKYGLPIIFEELSHQPEHIRFPRQLKTSIMNMENETENIFNSEEMVKGLGHKDFMNYVFDTDTDTVNLRDTMESLSPSMQCRNTIGDCNQCTCWICGEKILPIEDSYPECDHILPIARSILFSGIKRTKKMEKQSSIIGENADPKKMNDYYKLSYGYAHKSCNTQKSDIVLIKWDKSKKSIVYDEDEGNKLANKIVIKRPNTNRETLFGLYRDKINQLIVPINNEIKRILELPYGNMDLYWAYTIEIMKTYVEYEYLVANEKLKGVKLEKARHYIETSNEDYINRLISEQPTEDKLRDTAIQNLQNYRSQRLEALKSVKTNLMKSFSTVSKQHTVSKQDTLKRKSYPHATPYEGENHSLKKTKTLPSGSVSSDIYSLPPPPPTSPHK